MDRLKAVGSVWSECRRQMPAWLVDGLDQAARHFAVPRQAIVNMWLAEKLQEES